MTVENSLYKLDRIQEPLPEKKKRALPHPKLGSGEAPAEELPRFRSALEESKRDKQRPTGRQKACACLSRVEEGRGLRRGCSKRYETTHPDPTPKCLAPDLPDLPPLFSRRARQLMVSGGGVPAGQMGRQHSTCVREKKKERVPRRLGGRRAVVHSPLPWLTQPPWRPGQAPRRGARIHSPGQSSLSWHWPGV